MTDIQTNVAPPTEKPKRKRAVKGSAKKENPAATLIAALEHVAIAQRKEGTPYQTHCRLANHWAMAFDGLLSVGVPIAEDLAACPNTTQLQHALTKVGATLSISQLSEGQLRISSERFKATIDCAPTDAVSSGWPDQYVAPINDEVRKALEAVAWLVTEGADQPYLAGVLLQANSAVATNGHVICEYWHGCDLPPDMLIPKAAINALGKVKKKLTGFGYTPGNSATFWFEDGSYLKTQLFNGRYVPYTQIFDRANGVPAMPMPAEFFTALEAVAPFSKNKFIHFHADKLCSNIDTEQGASFDLPGLPGGMTFNAEYLKHIADYFDNVQFPTPSQLNFAKGSLRGAMMGGNASA
jgi:hypothetical protein